MKVTKKPHVLEAMRLLDLIDNVNETIQRHESRATPDSFAVRQYRELKQEYLGQFDSLMESFGFRIDLAKVA